MIKIVSMAVRAVGTRQGARSVVPSALRDAEAKTTTTSPPCVELSKTTTTTSPPCVELSKTTTTGPPCVELSKTTTTTSPPALGSAKPLLPLVRPSLRWRNYYYYYYYYYYSYCYH